LQALMGAFNELPGLVSAIRHEATYNRRQMLTVAGSLVNADGRSPFATAMLALDAQLVYLPGDQIEPVGTLFSLIERPEQNRLISKVLIAGEASLSYHYVARTPADLPIVCVSVARWPSGRTRVAVGGYGKTPKLAMDGPNSLGAEVAAKDVYQEAGDVWASALYRCEMAAVLARRCVEQLESTHA
jgi:CO/xanthine dehydrogenase FAD-binding subunit